MEIPFLLVDPLTNLGDQEQTMPNDQRFDRRRRTIVTLLACTTTVILLFRATVSTNFIKSTQKFDAQSWVEESEVLVWQHPKVAQQPCRRLHRFDSIRLDFSEMNNTGFLDTTRYFLDIRYTLKCLNEESCVGSRPWSMHWNSQQIGMFSAASLEIPTRSLELPSDVQNSSLVLLKRLELPSVLSDNSLVLRLGDATENTAYSCLSVQSLEIVRVLHGSSSTSQSLDDLLPRVRSSPRNLQVINKELGSPLYCRITTLDIMLDKEETQRKGFFNREEFVCIPIQSDNGKESDRLLTIIGGVQWRLTPRQLSLANEGQLLAKLQAYTLKDEYLILPDDPKGFQVIENAPSHWPHQGQRTTGIHAMGEQTLAIVRVSTRDSAPPVSLEAVRLHYAASRQSAAAQYKLCSFSKFQLQFKSGHDVKLPNSIREFSSGSQLLEAAMAKLSRDLNLASMTDLADKVVFCLAPGTKGWVATAGVNFYRLVVNGDWCLSLSVAMHELGHTVGLIHSGDGSAAYGDESGYMGYGDKAVKWPRKCFNALNHWQLRWYRDRHKTISDAKSLTGPHFVTLAAFVDYQKTGHNKKVILNIEDTYYLQYNRAKAFNMDTEEHRNKVVVIQDTEGYSELLKGMDVNQGISLAVRGSGSRLVIMVCQRVDGTGDDPDFMVLSVSMNRSYCGQWNALR